MLLPKKKLTVLLVGYLWLFLLCPESFAYELTGYKWKESDFPVSYYINQNGSGDISGDAEFTAIQAAFQTWMNVGTSSAMVTYRGTTSLEGGAGYDTSYDGYNVLSWAETAGTAYTIVQGAIAVCLTWYDGSNYILDSDIIFNGVDYTWGTDLSKTKMDVQDIATHEIGHFFGLADLYGAADIDKTMYGFGTTGETKKRDLHQDDIDGISVLYPYAGITNLTVTPIVVGDASWILLSWKNPNYTTFNSVMIRYRTDGVYPSTTSDGTFLVEKSGTANTTDYYSHTGVTPGTTYHYSLFAHNTGKGYADVNTTSQQSASPVGTGGQVGGGGGGCFIATACYGDINAAEVLTLRKFRDRYLAATACGRTFIKLYYLISPGLCSLIEKNAEVKIMVRFLLEPLIAYTEFLTGGR